MVEEKLPLTGEVSPTIQGADQEKLDEIVSKDSKAGRTMTGFWYYFTAGAWRLYGVVFLFV